MIESTKEIIEFWLKSPRTLEKEYDGSFHDIVHQARIHTRQLMQQIEQLQSASQLQSDVYRKLELRHREQAKELEQAKLDRDVHKEAMGISNQEFVDREEEIEQLRKERDEIRKHLWEAIKALEFIIVKTGNEPYNVQFIVKPLRDIAREALFHIQGKENTTNG